VASESKPLTGPDLGGGRVLALVTVGRDLLSLRAEAALEAGDERALKALLVES